MSNIRKPYDITSANPLYNSIQQAKTTLGKDIINVLVKNPEMIERMTREQPEAETNFNTIMMRLAAAYGELGWALIDATEILDPQSRYDAQFLLTQASQEPDKQPDLDSKLAALFSEGNIHRLFTEITEDTQSDDKVLLQHTSEYYRQKRYYECAMLLASFIDKQNINIAVDDITKNKAKQGWMAFQDIIAAHYKILYGCTQATTKTTPTKKDIKDRIIHTVFDEPVDVQTVIAANVTMCMMTLFNDVNWTELRAHKIPASINRHWLAHGMYSYHDVVRADCIKLLVLAYQQQQVLPCDDDAVDIT